MASNNGHAVALVGIGCRVPGANTAEEFWQLLREGVDAIREVPDGHFDIADVFDPTPGRPGRIYTRLGGFLDRVDHFDAAFFGVSPREAAKMDPQQRLLLEVSWNALEDAGLLADKLAGSRTGVYVGALYNDYEDLLISQPQGYDVHAYAGGMRSSMAGRLAHQLDLQGPAMSVDTACSSSLVAVHLACQALMNGECQVALAGGSNLMLVPVYSMGYCSAKMFALDGRVKAFDARANGTIRGEAVGMVVLKPLAAALADKDPIYGVITGSAVNHDGHSSPFMQPSQHGQQALLREAYQRAGRSPSTVQYVETHGTGTSVGDPIEVTALGKVMGPGRPEGSPLRVGSVKTNLGHSEGAAGIVSLIKVAMAMREKALPPTINFQTPNPNIAWDDLSVKVQTKLEPWKESPRVAGVNSFGISGVNAHVVLESAPVAAIESRPPPRRAQLLVLSAQAPAALEALADRYATALREPSAPSLEDFCYTAALRRSPLTHRLALVGDSAAAFAEQLDAFRSGQPRAGMTSARKPGQGRHRLAFVFSGQGSQWVGMGRRLMDEEPVFRQSIEKWDALMRKHVSWSLLDELRAGEDKSHLSAIDVVQPVLVAVQAALAEVWLSWGITPDAVVGHSLGEVTAAYIAGALSLEDAVTVVCVRSRLFKRVEGKGAMLAVELPMAEALGRLAPYDGRVSLACSNSPVSTVFSGDPEPVAALQEALTKEGIFAKPVKVNFAAHSHQLQPLKDEYLAALAHLKPRALKLPLFSSVLRSFGRRPADGEKLDAEYWWKNMRDSVLFAEATADLFRAGHSAFLEVSPHPVLSVPLSQAGKHASKEIVSLPSTRRGEDELLTMLGSLGALYANGHPVEFERLFPHGRCVRLPGYPWQGERHWFDEAGGDKRGRRARGEHPLLGEHTPSASNPGVHVWTCELDAESPAYLADHRVQGSVLFPTTGYVELMLAAAGKVFSEQRAFEVKSLKLNSALVLTKDEPTRVQVEFVRQAPGQCAVRVFSRPAAAKDSETWTEVVSATLSAVTAEKAPRSVAPSKLRAGLSEELTAQAHYEETTARGVEYGPRFQTVLKVSRRPGEALGQLKAPGDTDPESGRYRLHPATLDACLQLVYAALPRDEMSRADTLVPVSARSLVVHDVALGEELFGHALLRPRTKQASDEVQADVVLMRGDGQVVCEINAVTFKRLGSADKDRFAEWTLRCEWRAAARPEVLPVHPPGTWVLFAEHGELGQAVVARLRERGDHCVVVRPFRRSGDSAGSAKEGEVRITPGNEAELRALFDQLAELPPCRGIVYLWSARSTGVTSSLTGLLDAQDVGVLGVSALLRELAGRKLDPAPRLWLVTRGTQAVGNEPQLSIDQAPVWGLGRVLLNEHPELRCTLVDLSPTPSATEVLELAEELRRGDAESEVALRDTERYTPRLVRGLPDHAAQAAAPVETVDWTTPYRLESGSPGMLEALAYRLREPQEPKPGEVEIHVTHVGLNFRDIMLAMGAVPPLRNDGVLDMGWECAGRIARVGPGVSLAVGQEVVAIAPPCFGSFVTVTADLVRRRPAKLTPEQAAGIPLAFATAQHALVHHGRLKKGERVLIHAAAGGVGLAAIQVARRAGAEVLATAGSAQKRAFLRDLGVEHVFSSRSLEFREEVMQATRGEGVDVVLNSLAGEFIQHGFSTLREGGRFLEIGKVDMFKNTALGMGAFFHNRSFSGVDVSSLVVARPAEVGRLLDEVLEGFSAGAFQPLPVEPFSAASVKEAFRHMAQAKHIGKVVLTLEDTKVEAEQPVRGSAPIRGDGAYLITGGLGGLGLEAARLLAKKGARSLVLVGRSAPSAEAQSKLEELRAQGVSVQVERLDVANSQEVSALIQRVVGGGQRLRGVLHAAGVLDDGMAVQLGREKWMNVLRPKLVGAWNLHAHTLDLGLEHFIVYSSAMVMIGSPGQANYAAANAFLDSLVQLRRARGLPGLSIAWGPWTEVGLAAAPERAARMAERGVGSLRPVEGMRLLDRLLSSTEAHVVVMPFDGPKWAASYPAAKDSSLLRELVTARAPTEEGDAPKGVRATMMGLEPKDRAAAVEQYLKQQVSQALKYAESRIDTQTALSRMGLDSLMALELKNRVDADLAITIPVLVWLEGATVASLTQRLLDKLFADEAGSPASAAAPAAGSAADLEDLAKRVNELSMEEVTAALERMAKESKN